MELQTQQRHCKNDHHSAHFPFVTDNNEYVAIELPPLVTVASRRRRRDGDGLALQTDCQFASRRESSRLIIIDETLTWRTKGVLVVRSHG